MGLRNCGGSVNESLSLDRPGSIGTPILDMGQEEGKGKEGAGGGEEGRRGQGGFGDVSTHDVEGKGVGHTGPGPEASASSTNDGEGG